jgi:hypothetical protein
MSSFTFQSLRRHRGCIIMANVSVRSTPFLGFGTHHLRGDSVRAPLRSALKHGYRLVDGVRPTRTEHNAPIEKKDMVRHKVTTTHVKRLPPFAKLSRKDA